MVQVDRSMSKKHLLIVLSNKSIRVGVRNPKQYDHILSSPKRTEVKSIKKKSKSLSHTNYIRIRDIFIHSH
jgi:hypothetical protein